MKQHVVFSFLLILTLGSYRSSDAQESARELYLEGREHLIDERFEEALAQFRRVVSDFRASEEADDAQYYVGYCLAELERVEEALEAYAILLDRWPDSVRVERARAQRAELLARRRGEDANDDLFREVFDGSSSWALKRDTAFALARKGNSKCLPRYQNLAQSGSHGWPSRIETATCPINRAATTTPSGRARASS